MASGLEMREIALRAIKDDDFRAAFEADPEKAIASLGITLTEEQLLKIKTGLKAGQRRQEAFGTVYTGPGSFIVVAISAGD